MFADVSVIKASRQYVCVRIESYESELHQKLIRRHFDGKFVNTAFCLLSPDGNKRLSQSSRGISRPFGNNNQVAVGLTRIAKEYPSKADFREALTPDFHSFRQALNVAAADQRVLVLVAVPEEQRKRTEKRLRNIAWHDDVVGRFHFDFETDPNTWQTKLTGKNQDNGIFLIKSSKFGINGTILARVPLEATDAELLNALNKANEEFARTTTKTDYTSHVAEGRRKGYFFEMAMPYGEDRNADGKVDANFQYRVDNARRWAQKTGNLIPLEIRKRSDHK